MQDTRDDHEYDVRQNGLDGLSEDLDKQLEETLYDVTHNAEKQEQVISGMLNRVVGNYQQAYDKIQQIINSTGFVPNKDLSNNLGNLGTSNGAQDQVDNSMTNAPNYRPDDWTGVNTGQIQNGTTQDKNDQIQGDISKNPDLSNRPVAEITLSPGTLSIQEGSTGTVSATIRPNDAKNKSLQWVSSNPDVATVANGTVHAVKAGSTTISAIATDGGGATSTNSCAVTVTPKPEPPKPTTPPPSNNGGGDGVPNVGDKVVFASGDYFYSSDGQSPAGNEMRGQEVYITSVNNANWAQKKYHISRTSRFGERDLGWVSLDQLRGYASGTKKFVNGSEIVRINEGNNPEMMVRRGGLTGTATTESNSQWTKVVKVKKVSDVSNKNIDITPPINSTTFFYEAYLSRGTIDTSWTPAPEDDAEEIIGLKSEIKQTAERIDLTVGNMEKEISQLSIRAGEIEQTVKDTEKNLTSKIESTAGEINQKVEDTKNDLKAEISLSADNIIHTVGKNHVTAIRYIRDWLNGSNLDNQNRWTEINVFSKNVSQNHLKSTR